MALGGSSECNYRDTSRTIRATYTSTARLRASDGRRVNRAIRCLPDPEKAGMRRYRARWRSWRRSHAKQIRARRLWRYYRRHPMPYCTWGPESGGNVRARNSSSTAGGKYQILDGTWHANGGKDYPGSHDAAQAPPLEQERIARRVMASQGPGAWVGC